MTLSYCQPWWEGTRAGGLLKKKKKNPGGPCERGEHRAAAKVGTDSQAKDNTSFVRTHAVYVRSLARETEGLKMEV